MPFLAFFPDDIKSLPLSFPFIYGNPRACQSKNKKAGKKEIRLFYFCRIFKPSAERTAYPHGTR